MKKLEDLFASHSKSVGKVKRWLSTVDDSNYKFFCLSCSSLQIQLENTDSYCGIKAADVYTG